MKRFWLLIALASLGLTLVNYSGAARQILLTLGLTTAGPPSGMQLIQTASMEPVILTLRKDPRQQGYTESKDPKDQPWIRYKIPAAYIWELSGTLGEDGKAGFAMSVWADTLEPSIPDEIERYSKCIPYIKRREECPQSAMMNTKAWRKIQANEFPVIIRVPPDALTLAEQQKSIGRVIPVQNERPPITDGSSGRSGPCIIRDDPVLGLRVFSAPPQLPGNTVTMNGCSSWMKIAGAGTRLRDGRVFRPMHFLKLNLDGTYKFSVKCNDGYSQDKSVHLSRCDLVGAYGIWSLDMLLNAHSAETWDRQYDQALKFLANHEIGRKEFKELR